jgi:hypothetical protein
MNKPYVYWYLHINGELIQKNAQVVDSMGVNDYFDSPMVVKYWKVYTEEDLEDVKREVELILGKDDSTSTDPTTVSEEMDDDSDIN